MKLIIAGSRVITDYEILRQAVVSSGLWEEYKRTIEIVSGGAKGVDRLGEEFAWKNDLRIRRFLPDWDANGKSAGHIRNREMGDFAKANGGCLLALWDGVSVGTRGMIEYAKKIGLRRVVFIRENGEFCMQEE